MLIFFSPLFIILFIVCFIETGKPVFLQNRIGKFKRPFTLYKFRTMKVNTPSMASHLVNDKLITNFGRLIRSLKLDELPQLINVINGEMSLIGPRPCLFNQEALIKEREIFEIFSVKPGITGLAQIKGVDMSDPKKLTMLDKQMIDSLSLKSYFSYLLLTFIGKGIGDRIINK